MVHCYRCNAPLLPHESSSLHRFNGLKTYLCDGCQAIMLDQHNEKVGIVLASFFLTLVFIATSFGISYLLFRCG